MLLKAIIIFVSVVLYKAISNATKYHRCKKFHAMFKSWIADECASLPEYKREIISLIKGAGVSDSFLPTSQPVGYGQVANYNASVLENFPSRIAIFAASVDAKFDEAIGEYRHRTYEAFNPLYWIDIVIFLPKHLLSYIGLSDSNTAFKITNVILTALWWLICTGVTFFKPYILSLISTLFS